MNDVLSSIGHAISLAKRLREVSKNIEDAEFKNLLADLNLELADTKLALAGMIEENAQLKMELTQVKHSQGNGLRSLVFKEFAYYTLDDDGPFCSACYETKKQQIRLSKVTGAFTTFGHSKCPSCDEYYGGKI
jgi:regulator of replication initiation timing